MKKSKAYNNLCQTLSLYKNRGEKDSLKKKTLIKQLWIRHGCSWGRKKKRIIIGRKKFSVYTFYITFSFEPCEYILPNKISKIEIKSETYTTWKVQRWWSLLLLRLPWLMHKKWRKVKERIRDLKPHGPNPSDGPSLGYIPYQDHRGRLRMGKGLGRAWGGYGAPTRQIWTTACKPHYWEVGFSLFLSLLSSPQF